MTQLKSRRWKDLSRGQKRFVLGAVATHFVIVGIAHRDIMLRDGDEIRGPKRMWRLLTTANSLFTVIYFLVGRRRPTAS